MKKILKELFLKNEEFIIKQLINFIIVFIAAFMAISWAMDLRGFRMPTRPLHVREMRPRPMPEPTKYSMPNPIPSPTPNDMRPPMPPEQYMQEHSRPIPPENTGIPTPSNVPPKRY